MNTLRAKTSRILLWVGLAAIFSGQTSCQDRPVHYDFPLESEISWPFWPVMMRVHALTRFVENKEDGSYWLEARIEFRDQHDDISKCYGTINLKLFGLTSTGESSDMVGSWDVNLLDPDTNRTHFDVVTSTYLFKLDVSQTQLASRMELRAVFVNADTSEFESSLDVKPRFDSEN